MAALSASKMQSNQCQAPAAPRKQRMLEVALWSVSADVLMDKAPLTYSVFATEKKKKNDGNVSPSQCISERVVVACCSWRGPACSPASQGFLFSLL